MLLVFLIDNIFTNCFSQSILSEIIFNDISDYLPISSFFNNESAARKKETSSHMRDFSEINFIKFRSSLSQVNWSNALIDQDPSALFDAFTSEYRGHFEGCFPLKTTKQKTSKQLGTPWISKILLTSVRKTNRRIKDL